MKEKKKEKILVADDEKDLARAIGMILKYSDYEVDIVENGKQAFEKAKEINYDAMILDIMMPEMDGIQALKEMRKDHIKTPVLFLTAKSQVDDKVEGLDAGANDYLTKPFDQKELLARVRALIRVKEEGKEKYKIGNLIFNKEKSEISSEKASLHLNHKECEVMEFLVNNQERIIDQKELEKRVWENEEKNENVVTMYIAFLQDKFSALGANVRINDKNGYVLEKIV